MQIVVMEYIHNDNVKSDTSSFFIKLSRLENLSTRIFQYIYKKLNFTLNLCYEPKFAFKVRLINNSIENIYIC